MAAQDIGCGGEGDGGKDDDGGGRLNGGIGDGSGGKATAPRLHRR